MTASKTGAKPGPGVHTNVTCPFCGILCDDLEIQSNGSGLKILKNGCDRAVAGFERSVAGAKPQVAGKDVDLATAVWAATDLVKGAKLPLYGGLATDVEGVRAVLALADKSGGVVDHALSEAQYRNFRVLQTSGWFMSTLTETRNRADLIVFVGSDIHKLHPRFFERVVNVTDSMIDESPPKRTLVFIGEGLDTSGAEGPRVGDIVTLPCPLDQVSNVVGALKAIIKGSPLKVEEVGGVKLTDIAAAADRIRKAAYGVFVWAPPSLAAPHSELIVQLVSELVKELNLEGRYACLSLAGNEGAVTAAAVCAWQSGYPLRVSFSSGKPDYDHLRYAIPRMLADGDGDLLFWVASFTPDIAPPAAKIPTVVLGTPGMTFKSTPDVYIPIGTPGADHEGRIIRCDNVVSLPLRDLNRADLPKLADILADIELAL